ncbi:siderophore-interacting protein [Streptomyces phytohabitans]|uniref:siderophore-interacting protein n=1 Tax=Streptomyces phytohabitans TaxID=1150371 RepID=UPI00345BD5FE
MIPRVKRARQRRVIPLEVRANVRVSPSFRRLTFGGPALAGFTSPGLDHAVRLFFPRAGQEGLWLPSLHNDAWMAETLFQPVSRRPWVRTYTVREHRPEQRELDIEFALHGDQGPASAWAARARPGDPAGMFEEGYSYLPPDRAGTRLLVADESALPAALSVLAGAPPDLTGHAYLEVPTAADIRADLARPDGVRVTWLPRDSRDGPHGEGHGDGHGAGDGESGGAVPGALALETVRHATGLGTPAYTWVAGESKLVTGVRRHLVGQRAVPKRDIAFVGYWRHGRASPG